MAETPPCRFCGHLLRDHRAEWDRVKRHYGDEYRCGCGCAITFEASGTTVAPDDLAGLGSSERTPVAPEAAS